MNRNVVRLDYQASSTAIVTMPIDNTKILLMYNAYDSVARGMRINRLEAFCESIRKRLESMPSAHASVLFGYIEWDDEQQTNLRVRLMRADNTVFGTLLEHLELAPRPNL